MDYAALAVAVLALGLSIGAMVRKKNEVQHGLRVQLDEALEENKRLLEERAKLQDELHAAKVKANVELLARYADEAVAYAEQVGGSAADKLRHAQAALLRLDDGDNGKRDWGDAQHRMAIEAALARRAR